MDIITKINWVDVLVLIIMLRISYIAFQDGLSHEIFPLAGSVCTIILALHYYNKIASFISQNILKGPEDILALFSFVALFVGIGFVFKFIRIVFDKIIKVTWHPLIERFGGLAAGLARAAIVVSSVLIALTLVPLSYLQWSIRDRSLTGMYFLRIGPRIYEKASKFLPALKIEGSSVDSEKMVKNLVSDKSITAKEKKDDKAAERE